MEFLMLFGAFVWWQFLLLGVGAAIFIGAIVFSDDLLSNEKWAGLAVFLVAAFFATSSLYNVDDAKAFVENGSWLTPIIWWLGIGAAWSVVEFFMHVRGVKGVAKHILEYAVPMEIRERIKAYNLAPVAEDSEKFKDFYGAFLDATRIINRNVKARFIEFEVTKNDKGFIQVTPDLSIASLSGYILDWIVFFPLFMVKMAFGRFLNEIVDFIATTFKKVFGGIVRQYFSDLFKL
jgi:hypothetical protein